LSQGDDKSYIAGSAQDALPAYTEFTTLVPAPEFTADEQRWSALMASAQRGNERDYRCLLEELASVLERYFHSRIGGDAFVEDCVQEVLIAVHEGRHTYDPRRGFRAWLFAIARHKAVDRMRRKARERETPMEQMPDTVDDSGSLEATVASGQLLGALSVQHREAIILTKLVGMSTAEAARRLAISESALRVRVHRGISRLKHLLDTERW
jgi:RNA polymerase sigma-70 factor (ECF subfamily)